MREKLFGYLYVYFRADIYGEGESQHIHMAVSEDGLHYRELNHNEPVLRAELGTRGVRDPHIFRSEIDGKIYLIATDLDANGGDWYNYAFNGSKKMALWTSDDLINWSDEMLVSPTTDDACCMWAPKVCYDQKKKNYLMSYSSGIIGEEQLKIYSVRTTDFVHFTTPEILRDIDKNVNHIKNLGTDKENEYVTYIDSTTFKIDNTYYRFTKREQDITIFLEKSSEIDKGYELIKDVVAGEYGVEGPGVFRLNGEDKWILLMDGYVGDNKGIGYFPLVAESRDDVAKGNFVRLTPDKYRMPVGAKHGSVMPITKKEYDNLLSKWQ